MSRSKRDILDTESMLQRLAEMLYQHHAHSKNKALGKYVPGMARADAEALRRISMTLHRWHELECGTDNGHVERRGDKQTPFLVQQGAFSNRSFSHAIPDRERGALARLKAIMTRYPSLSYYVQGDPRGCALYILKPGDVPAGEDVSAYYSRGLAVFR